jgi:hypothetical protein
MGSRGSVLLLVEPEDVPDSRRSQMRPYRTAYRVGIQIDAAVLSFESYG